MSAKPQTNENNVILLAVLSRTKMFIDFFGKYFDKLLLNYHSTGSFNFIESMDHRIGGSLNY